MLRLVLPAPPTPPVSLVPTVRARWEPGVQARWRAHLSSSSFLARLQVATTCGDPQSEAAAVDALLLEACQEVGLTHNPHLHNPN